MPMKTTLGAGLRRLSAHKKGIVLAYAVNLAVAGIVLLPFMTIFEESLEGGLYNEKLLENLDYDWYQLFSERVSGFASTFSPGLTGYGPFLRNLEALLEFSLTALPGLLVALGFIYVLANTYVNAAFIGSLAMDPGGTTVREFLRTGGEFMGRFFRLSLLSLFAFFAVNSLILEPVRAMAHELAVSSLTDRIAFYWELGVYCLALPLLLLLNMIFDYAKITLAQGNRTSSFLALCSALRFVWTYPGNALLLYAVLILLGTAGVFVFVSVESWIPPAGIPGMAVAIGVQQLYLAFRIAMRLYFYSAQTQFYLDREEAFLNAFPAETASAPDDHAQVFGDSTV